MRKTTKVRLCLLERYCEAALAIGTATAMFALPRQLGNLPETLSTPSYLAQRLSSWAKVRIGVGC